MIPVPRSAILDHLTYAEHRQDIRAAAMAAKDLRRVHAGPYLTFLFENPETVRYQVLEMVRAEQLVREADIRHELATYNALLGDPGDLGCTLLLEIPDEAERSERLQNQVLSCPFVPSGIFFSALWLCDFRFATTLANPRATLPSRPSLPVGPCLLKNPS